MTELPDLDRLIATLVADTTSGDPLDRLAAAARIRDDLDELAEALLDHFVDQARQAGCSWSQIGTALGVSKQAAQQRHTAAESVARRLLGRIPGRRRGRGGLFQRFTDRARESVVLAQQEARRLNHNYIGTEHILLGLLRLGDGVAAKALASLDVSLDGVREGVEEIIGQGPTAPGRHIPFTPRAKKVLELSLRESIRLGHNSIGTEHILLGLLRLGDGVALQVLNERGVDEARAREAVLSLLAGPT